MDQPQAPTAKPPAQPGPRRALGRGLDALLPSVPTATAKEAIQQIEL